MMLWIRGLAQLPLFPGALFFIKHACDFANECHQTFGGSVSEAAGARSSCHFSKLFSIGHLFRPKKHLLLIRTCKPTKKARLPHINSISVPDI